MKKVLTTALAALSLAVVPGAHAAGKCTDTYPLHGKSSHAAASCGTRVRDEQWLLGGHRPNVFRQIKGTFTAKPNGLYGARTKSAVKAYKWRLGYPQKGQCGATVNEASIDTSGVQLRDYMAGKRKRTPCMVALAAARVRTAAAAQPSKVALAMRLEEQRLLGVSEHPDGSNRGPCVSYSCTWGGRSTPALQSGTGAYGVAWCVSTQQTVLRLVGYGTFADDTAGVYYAVDYAAARNWTSAKAKLGALVAFIDYDSRGHRIPGTGHMGFVAKVEGSSFTYIAGNDGNAVREHTIPFGSRPYVFIYLRGVA